MKTRRQFLGQASCAAVSSIPILSTLLNLRLAGNLAAATTPANGEYRAVVCIFFSGGNDTFNMLTPYSGAEYATYQTSRSDLALPQSQLVQIFPDNTPGRTFGVHHRMPNLAAHFNAGNAAFVANVGTLIEPVANRTEVAQNLKRLPLGLYSHSDQIEQWQTSVPHSRSGIGWAGRTADLLKELNTIPAFTNISLDGSNVFQTGNTIAEYAAYPGNSQQPDGGAIALTGYNPAYAANEPIFQPASAATDSQIAQTYSNLLQQTWQNKRRSALDAYAAFSTALTPPLAGTVTWPNTTLGRQLKVVARAIQGRATLGATRQTFFVNWGGWDHHSATLASQDMMLPEVDAALHAFQLQLAVLGLQNNVVTFSASDFGRTLTSNGQGSDHAWGGNCFVVGGNLLGKKIHGSYPDLTVNPDTGPEINPLDTGRGRLIPTTSCDAFFAEMALWLGVSKSNLPLIFPNIGNFYSTTSSTPPVGYLLSAV